MTRRCEVCGKDRLVPDEIRPKGKKCADCRHRLRKEYEARYLARTRERRAAYYRDYYARNREQIRQTQRLWYLNHRETTIARSKQWTRAHADRRRQYQANWYAGLKADADRYARYLEDKRMANRLRHERGGRPMRVVPEHVYLNRYGDGGGPKGNLSAAPLYALIRQWLDPMEDIGALMGMQTDAGLLAHTRLFLAEVAAVPDRKLREILYREGMTGISLRNADKLCIALGTPLALVYPEDAA